MSWMFRCRLHVPLFLTCLLVIGACAPVTYNRYQPAQPIGRGHFKYLTSVEGGRELAAAAIVDTWKQMDNKLLDRRVDRTEYQEDLENMETKDLLDKIRYLAMSKKYGYPVPNASFILAYGLNNETDLELSVSSTLYMRFGAKVLAYRSGRFSLSFAPGIGCLPINIAASSSSGGTKISDTYVGYVATVEGPLIAGWNYGFVSPYLALHLSGQHAKFEFSRQIEDSDPELEATIRPHYELFNVGLALGVQFKFDAFVFTPEVVGLYTSPGNTGAGWPAWFLSPGLAMGAQF